MIGIILLSCLLAALLFLLLWGYTTVRLPPARKAGKARLACVGDSVTYGCTLPLFFLRRYPAVLQRLLGPAVQVGVFGVNDRTLQDTGNKPFRREAAFRQSLAFQPDTVVLLLGTNDSKDPNWISPEAFRRQYGELVAAYRGLPSSPRILLCTAPCAFAPAHRFFYITNDAKLTRVPEIAELIRATAAEEGLELADLYALTAGRRELFGPDGLHPSPRGAAAIAEEIARVLKKPEAKKP